MLGDVYEGPQWFYNELQDSSSLPWSWGFFSSTYTPINIIEACPKLSHSSLKHLWTCPKVSCRNEIKTSFISISTVTNTFYSALLIFFFTYLFSISLLFFFLPLLPHPPEEEKGNIPFPSPSPLCCRGPTMMDLPLVRSHSSEGVWAMPQRNTKRIPVYIQCNTLSNLILSRADPI